MVAEEEKILFLQLFVLEFVFSGSREGMFRIIFPYPFDLLPYPDLFREAAHVRHIMDAMAGVYAFLVIFFGFELADIDDKAPSFCLQGPGVRRRLSSLKSAVAGDR